MENYYFKLVCVDEQNPIGYAILEDENFDSLDNVHKYVKDHLQDHYSDSIKWMLLPMKKSEVRIA